MTERDETAGDERDASLHQTILADIEGRIISGAWPPGHRIPFEVDLAAAYGCSRMTVNKVLTQLAKSGLIERRKRSGSFVRTPTSQAAVMEIRDIAAEVAALGLAYGYRLVRRGRRKATAADRARLELPAGGTVLHLVCLHSAGPEPFCLEERIVNLAAVPEAEAEDFSAEAPGVWLLRQVPWSSAEHVVRAVEADGETAELLAIRPGRACLVVERRTALAGAFVTHVTLTYPGHRHALQARFTPAQARAPT
ncbi:histidine utilization repressor [Oharaeibacter diazotrophicus]|uniref:Histidine utilization repressor n=1 Tax=Oharaeibacter diazotrophicus TaxID=1920512 RepID=A0A4R6RAQ3_9HYPH|nr:histidine utilization repressor [Oharaeibacter diazotrophicus]TDP83102.1 GntR family transcriptional regulator [Oharaeibacter diazotrophicus]BBE71933.1 HTH-type transcriptional repressor YvoA [Pleomorphomonas sp. SM30]